MSGSPESNGASATTDIRLHEKGTRMNSNAKSIVANGACSLALAAGLLAAAPGASAAVDNPEAACLFTQAELARAIGNGAGAGEPYEVKLGTKHLGWSCRYSAGSGRTRVDVSVEKGDAARFESNRKLAEHLAQPHQFHLLAGVGEAAFVGQGGSVEMLSGGRLLRVGHLHMAAGHSVGDAEIRALLQIGLERMGKVNVAGR
jgi:hypothetical protein